MKVEFLIAIMMAIVVVGTGAASQIIGTFGNAFGVLGVLAGFCLVLSLIFGVFSKK